MKEPSSWASIRPLVSAGIPVWFTPQAKCRTTLRMPKHLTVHRRRPASRSTRPPQRYAWLPSENGFEDDTYLPQPPDLCLEESRSEKHTSDLKSLMPNSNADFCLKKKIKKT